MRADDLVHVVIFLKLWMRNLTLPLVTKEQSYLREEPIQGRNSLENPEEQEHWVLTRRGEGPVLSPSASLAASDGQLIGRTSACRSHSL